MNSGKQQISKKKLFVVGLFLGLISLVSGATETGTFHNKGLANLAMKKNKALMNQKLSKPLSNVRNMLAQLRQEVPAEEGSGDGSSGSDPAPSDPPASDPPASDPPASDPPASDPPAATGDDSNPVQLDPELEAKIDRLEEQQKEIENPIKSEILVYHEALKKVVDRVASDEDTQNLEDMFVGDLAFALDLDEINNESIAKLKEKVAALRQADAVTPPVEPVTPPVETPAEPVPEVPKEGLIQSKRSAYKQ